MKVLALIFLITFAGGISKGQLSGDDKEKQFELEEETLQIHDSEAERKAAKEEAQRSEKLEKERRHQLDKLQVQKKHEDELSKKQLAVYRDRIVVAEKKRKEYETETSRLDAELNKLKMKVAEQEARAKSTEVAAVDANKILNAKKQEKIDLLKRQTTAIKNTSNSEEKIRSLKIQYARLSMETRQLEGHLKMMEEVEAKRDLERDKMSRDVSSMKDRRNSANDAVKAHQ